MSSTSTVNPDARTPENRSTPRYNTPIINRSSNSRAASPASMSPGTGLLGNGTRFIRVLIADDQSAFRERLRMLIEAEDGMQVVGEGSGTEQTLRMIRNLEPDVLLLALTMPGNSALEIIRELSARSVPVRVIALAGSVDKQRVVDALRLGARGVAEKDSPSRPLADAIRIVMDGQYCLDSRSAVGLLEALGHLPLPAYVSEPGRAFGLTTRELQIVEAIMSGDSNKGIAQKFSISERTVKQHLTNIFNKLGVASRLELAMFAVNHRLVPEGQASAEPVPAAPGEFTSAA
jgi:two-component system, NarL family, nitrate/nitrite response regulator NarL